MVMSESKDSLHLHILAKSCSSSFLCWCKRRGKGRMPPVAQDMSDKPWITPAYTQGKLSHPAPQPWIYVPEGKTTPNISSCPVPHHPGARKAGRWRWFYSFWHFWWCWCWNTTSSLEGSFLKTWNAPEKQKQLTTRHVGSSLGFTYKEDWVAR